MKKTIAILIITFLANCQATNNDLKFEKQVMNEIFLTLVDSIYRDLKVIPPPPPPYPDIFFSTPNQKIKDSIIDITAKQYEKVLQEFEKPIEILQNENKKIIIAIQDSILSISENYKSKLISAYGNLKFDYDSFRHNSDYKIDLVGFNKSDKYEFRYLSEFPNSREIWRWSHENDFYLKAVISFSRILFDKNKEFGVLTGGISYGKLDGNGMMIFIKKEGNTWVIDKIIGTRIS